MKCYCDNCLFGKPITPPHPMKTLEELKEQVVQEFGEDDGWDDTPRCSGYFFECEAELDDWEDDLCDSCKKEQARQEYLEDLAVEAWERRQIEMERVQLEQAYNGDDDGGENGDDDDELLCDECDALIESGSTCGPCRRLMAP